jgi:hypothetical protein
MASTLTSTDFNCTYFLLKFMFLNQNCFYFHGNSTVDPDEGQVTKDPGLMSASAKSEWSQSDTDISNVEERMYQSGNMPKNNVR